MGYYNSIAKYGRINLLNNSIVKYGRINFEAGVIGLIIGMMVCIDAVKLYT
jgi:hypothetical protein